LWASAGADSVAPEVVTNSRVVLLGVLLASPTILALNAPAKENPTVPVGDPRIDGSFLKPYRNAWKFSYRKPGAEEVLAGIWTDELREDRSRGRRVFVRTQEQRDRKERVRTTTVNVFDPKTLAPISMDWKMDAENFNHRDFDGARVRFRRMAAPAGGVLQQGDVTLEAPPFDFLGGMYGLIAVALPLAPGFTARIPALDERDEVLRWVDLRVTGQDMVEAGPGKRLRAWQVEASTPDGPMTFWLTRKAPYVLKLVFRATGGVVWTYTMV
jgi:hypothetical protein